MGLLPGSRRDRQAALNQICRTLEKRALDMNGVVDPYAVVTPDEKILLELPGSSNPTRDATDICGSASLDFYYLKDVQTPRNPIARWKIEMLPGNSKAYLFVGSKGEKLDSSSAIDTPKVLKEVVGIPANKPILTGADLVPNAKASVEPRNGVIINIEFNEKGTQIFRDFTALHIGEIVAVFYNGKLLTAPTIRDKINDGKAQISGFKDLREAKLVTNLLNSGTIPVRLDVIGSKP